MIYEVILSVRARKRYAKMVDYLSRRFSVENAEAFGAELLTLCDTLKTFPKRGTPKPNLGSGARTIGLQNRVTVLFRISEPENLVIVLDFSYRGRELNP